MPIRSILFVLLLLGTSGAVLADDIDELDERLQAIEERMSKSGEQGSGGMLGMVGDLQRTQEEVRSLRGDVERLQFEAEQNRLRQREIFIDFEKRLNSLEANPAKQPTSPSANQPGAVITPPPVPQPTIEANAPAAPSAPGAPVVIQPPVNPEQHAEPPPATAESANAVPPPATRTISEQDAYLEAFEVLKQGRYDESIKAFEAFLLQFPDGEYADNARYWLAETYYVKKNFPVSLQQFQQLLAEYPDSSKLPGALLKIGYIQYELGNNIEARQSLERVRIEFSDSSVADLAKQRLERMDREGR